MDWQRLTIGLVAVGFLVIGGALHLAHPEGAAGYVGILVRVGVLLSVIWLAMPQLEQLKTKISTLVLLVLLLSLILIAARPNLFRVAAGIFAVTLVANWALKWLGRFAGSQSKR